MKQKILRIGEAADILGLSIDTLRKWDQEGILKAFRPSSSDKRYYLKDDIDLFVESIRQNTQGSDFAFAQKWVSSKSADVPLPAIYCQSSDIFAARLESLSLKMQQDSDMKDLFPILIAMAGEIGNNSYNHNLGRWPNVPGSLFIPDLKKRQIILADRGQGVLATLKHPLPKLKTHKKALETAFTKYISGRAPENRGNGLKFVKDIISTNPFRLYFYSGNARLKLKEKDVRPNIQTLKNEFYHGCLAVIHY